MVDHVVVGGGHNGLVTACYLARPGLNVLVLEYREMDPFSIAVHRDGAIVRFHRSVEQTIESMREVAPADADRYRAWISDTMLIMRMLSAGLQAGTGRGRRLRRLPVTAWAAGQALARNGGPLGLAQLLLSPYGRMLEQRLSSDRVRAPVSAFAAHASASPTAPGSTMYGLWQAFYHQVGQWHAVGGAQGLVDALARRLEPYGGQWRTDAAVARVIHDGQRVTGVELDGGPSAGPASRGEHIPSSCVITAVDPQTALLGLLDPPLAGVGGAQLRATHRGNAVQMLVLLATTALPAYAEGHPGDWNGLQSYVDTVDSLADGFAQAEAQRLPDDPIPTYAFTPSALDGSLAPPGHHTIYLACPTAPFRVRGGWPAVREEFAERMIDTVQARAPGFRSTIVRRTVRTAQDMAQELRWPGAHPMSLDVSLDQLGPLRPTRALSGHDTPIAGLFVTGAGTAPVGGIAGSPGRAAAKAVLTWRRRSGR